MALRGTYDAWYARRDNRREPEADAILFWPLDTAVNPTTPAALLTSVATGVDRRLAFAILGADNRVHVIHRVLRYVPPLGQPRMPYDNVTLATFGDTTALGVTTVEIPATFFTRTALLPRLLTNAALTRIAVANPDGQCIPGADTPPEEIMETRTRKATLIPSSMVCDVLRVAGAAGGLSPRMLWLTQVEPMLAFPNRLLEYAPFVDWVRVAYSGGLGEANPVQWSPTPPPRHLEVDLAEQRASLFAQDFPVGLEPPPIEGGNNLLVAAIGDFRADLAAREESKVLRAALKRAADQRPSSRWYASTTRLLRLCHVQDEAELPPIWQAMAAHGAKLDRNTIQYHLSLDMPDLDSISSSGTASVCSPELSKSLGQLTFQTGSDDIQSGIHIFAVCYPTQASRSKANQVAGLYDEKVQSITGMTLDETVTLKAAQTFLLPVGYVELQLVCCGYHRFLGTLFGTVHPVVTAMGELVKGLKEDVTALHPYFDSNISRTTGMLRYIQLSMYSWIKRQIQTDAILDPPNFSSIFERIEQQLWVIPVLPPQYCAGGTTEKLAPTGNTTSQPVLKKGVYESTPANHLSDLVPVNKQFDPQAFIRLHGAPPNNDKGGAMCLLYHVKGQCRQDCDRGQGVKSDHRRHSQSETAKLVAYLNKGK